jgi:hypothetical protein
MTKIKVRIGKKKVGNGEVTRALKAIKRPNIKRSWKSFNF